MLCLISSNTQSVQAIKHYLAKDTKTPWHAQLLWIGALHNQLEAKAELRQLANETNNPFWLNKLMQLGDGSAAWQRYQESPSDPEASQWLRLAALGGIANAQYTYAMQKRAASEKEHWLLMAAEQGLQRAQLALAEWYLLQHQQEMAMPWLQQAATFDRESQLRLAKIKWQLGLHEESEQLYRRAAKNKHPEAVSRLKVITQEQRYGSAQNTELVFSQDECTQRIAIVANGLEQMVAAKKLITAFQQDQRLHALNLCLSEPIWLDKVLDCDMNWQNARQLGCDISPLTNTVVNSAASHLVVIAAQGKANVQNGVMFLDASDDYNVFVHELAHFAGFVDEYQLKKQSAQAYCGVIQATNLIFDGKIAYAPLEQVNYWQTVPYFGGVYPANTCKNADVQAYKPVSDITFMEYHDSANIPRFYISLWRNVLLATLGDRPVLRYLSTQSAVAPQTATGITTKLSNGINEQTLTAMPKETERNRSALSN